MTWICEFCGWENYQLDRIALKEPACIRCGQRRGSLDKRVAELENEIAILTGLEVEYRQKIGHLEDVNASLRDEIAANAAEHDSLLDDRKENLDDLIKARSNLQALEALYAPRERLIAEDQSRLIGGRAKGLYKRGGPIANR